MTGGQTSHITVSYRDSGAEIDSIYAVNEDISREFGLLKLSGKDLKAWLESRRCRLDSSDGPALIVRFSRTTTEYYYRNGKPHREDGPAYVVRYADGSTYEKYCLDGVRLRKDEYDARTHPLLTGFCLPLANGGQDAIDALLREAIAEQSLGVSALRTVCIEEAGRFTPPLVSGAAIGPRGSQPGKRRGREYVPFPQP